ncbi:MAG: hypothetical protein KGL74_01240 [Elusimicrobia bacterium]|nr:hypothetical protein [Elusimicrobiota bacterium]
MDEGMMEGGNQPATKADLDRFATKADLDRFATKADLDRFVTKADFDQFVTKMDFGRFATKEDIRSEIGAFRDEMRQLLRPITVTLANHTAELADIRGYVKDKLVTRDEFHSRMDAFTGRVDDYDYSSAKNRERLDAHEKRIAALEQKRA